MPYEKENGVYSFTDASGNKKFTSPNIAIITSAGKVINHGPLGEMNALAAQMRQSGQLISVVETDEWDLKSLNKQIANL